MRTEVELTYFKPSGKYYSSGKLKVPKSFHHWEIMDRVRERQRSAELPGLREGAGLEFTILVQPPNNGVPRLIHPLEASKD